MSDALKSTDFEPHLNQMFCIHLDNAVSIDLQLVSVTELGTESRDGFRNPFSLHFLGPISEQYLQQRTYQMVNEKMGTFDIFIVPLGTEAGRMRYEAIFT